MNVERSKGGCGEMEYGLLVDASRTRRALRQRAMDESSRDWSRGLISSCTMANLLASLLHWFTG